MEYARWLPNFSRAGGFMVRKLKNKEESKEKPLTNQVKDMVREDENLENKFIVLGVDDEEFQENKMGKYNFHIEHLTKEECNLPSFPKIENYEKKITIRIGELEEAIINYLKTEKGKNISELVRDYIRSLGSCLVDDNYREDYNTIAEEYNQTLDLIVVCQEERNEFKKLRGGNEYTANRLTQQRDFLKYKIQNLQSKAKKLNDQLEKMKKLLN